MGDGTRTKSSSGLELNAARTLFGDSGCDLGGVAILTGVADLAGTFAAIPSRVTRGGEPCTVVSGRSTKLNKI